MTIDNNETLFFIFWPFFIQHFCLPDINWDFFGTPCLAILENAARHLIDLI